MMTIPPLLFALACNPDKAESEKEEENYQNIVENWHNDFPNSSDNYFDKAYYELADQTWFGTRYSSDISILRYKDYIRFSDLYLGLFDNNPFYGQLASTEAELFGSEFSSPELGTALNFSEMAWSTLTTKNQTLISGLGLLILDANDEDDLVPYGLIFQFDGEIFTKDSYSLPEVQYLAATVFEVMNSSACTVDEGGVCMIEPDRPIAEIYMERWDDYPFDKSHLKQEQISSMISSMIPPTNHPLLPLQSAS